MSVDTVSFLVDALLVVGVFAFVSLFAEP